MIFIPHQILRGKSNQEEDDWLAMLHTLREITACWFLVDETPGTPWRKYEDNIKMYIKEMGLEGCTKFIWFRVGTRYLDVPRFFNDQSCTR
jgi:hypothetical protein